jgi:hypothetical protein
MRLVIDAIHIRILPGMWLVRCESPPKWQTTDVTHVQPPVRNDITVAVTYA